MFNSPEYFLSYVLLPEKVKYSFSHLRFLSVFKVGRVLFPIHKSNFAKSLLKCHHSQHSHQRANEGAPQNYIRADFLHASSKLKPIILLPQRASESQSKSKGGHEQGKICYK